MMSDTEANVILQIRLIVMACTIHAMCFKSKLQKMASAHRCMTQSHQIFRQSKGKIMF
jgi:hypothetical protein